MKNYFGFLNDNSGSMSNLRNAAIKDYNAITGAIVKAANQEMQDTIVSVVAIGVGSNYVERQVTVSNPHVLKPINDWKSYGGTPLYRGLLDLIALHEALPDVNKEDVSFVIFATTDGEADGDDKRNYKQRFRDKVTELSRTGRWTFVFRVPAGSRNSVSDLGIPAENIQAWSTTAEGMKKSTAQTEAAVSTFYKTRATGQGSTSVFYSDASAVNTAALTDISKEVKLYVCGEKFEDFDGIQIKDFILARRQQYMIGGAFYQLVKTEARVQPNKLILIREKNTGKVYAGAEARKMIGLDTVNNARLHPNHGGTNIDIFIQSESVNRKIGQGHGVLYWEAKGRPMTQADLEKFAPKPIVPAPVQMAQAPATGKPTASTIPVTPKPAANHATVQFKPVRWYASRAAARNAHSSGVKDGIDFATSGPNGERWFVFV